MASSVLVLVTRPVANSSAPDGTEPVGAGFESVDPDGRHLSALDLGATRGDGIFETISIGRGRPQALDAHLRRFARSARALDLPAPDAEVWRGAIDAAIAQLDPAEEAFVKTVLTRGVEGADQPTGWVYGRHAPDFTRQRTEGVRVVTLDRGYRHDVERTSPWLLAGAKTLSYAVNQAVVREAKRRGADDVIFVSSDGFVLEGPTSTVLYRRGDAILTPGTGLGILEGTTQGSLFELAESLGFTTGFELVTPAQLADVDAIWLVSSVRHAAPVRELDGVARKVDAELTSAMNEHLRSRIV